MDKNNSDQILMAVLTAPAYERLGRIKIYNQELYKKVESKVLQMYNSGQIRQPIEENAFVTIVDSFKTEKQNLKVVRKRNFGDLDDIL